MEALLPQLFIITAEASIVLLLLLIVMIVFNSKAKRRDLKAVNELIHNYNQDKEQRISTIKKQLKNINYKGNTDEQAEKLFQSEKSVIKEFVTLYLRRDTYLLLDYPDNLIESNNEFLKTSGTASATNSDSANIDNSSSAQTANAVMLAREQAESNDVHLKELAELRIKNTELNEQLFEALDTITNLMTEHNNNSEQEIEKNAQNILEAIIYLRDKRLKNENPGKFSSALDDKKDLADNFNLAGNDATLDGVEADKLGVNDDVKINLDSFDNDNSKTEKKNEEAIVVNLDDTPETKVVEKDDPWADALAEQADAEAGTTTENSLDNAAEEDEDPWAAALTEQADAEAGTTTENSSDNAAGEDEDPWAAALAEQADAEAETENPSDSAAGEDEDPWAAALAEQADAEAETENPSDSAAGEDEDPWAAALAEQADAEAVTATENSSDSADEEDDDPWAAALAEQADSENKTETEEADPWAEALAEQKKSENK